MITMLDDFFINLGFSDFYVLLAGKTVLVAGIVLISFLAFLIAKKILLSAINKITFKTKTKWDDIFAEQGLFNRLAHIVPVLIIYHALPLIFPTAGTVILLLQRILLSYMIAVVLLMLSSF